MDGSSRSIITICLFFFLLEQVVLEDHVTVSLVCLVQKRSRILGHFMTKHLSSSVSDSSVRYFTIFFKCLLLIQMMLILICFSLTSNIHSVSMLIYQICVEMCFCFVVFLQYLVENGYAHNVSMKSLQSPSVKDFLKIFTFIYGFLCPSYELPDSKFEEEIPRIFKELGYI